MRLPILVSLCAFCFLHTLHAQSSLDIRIGSTTTAWYSQNTKDGSHFTNGTSWQAGLSWRQRSDKILNWCGDVFLRNKSGHIYMIGNGIFSTTYDDVDVRMTYIGMTVTPEWHIEANAQSKVVISAGPYASLLAGGSAKGQRTNGVGNNVAIDENARDYFEHTDIGFLLGFGVHYQLNDQTILFAQYRFTHGLNDVTAAFTGNEKLNSNNHDFGLGVGFLFPKDPK